MDKDNGEITQAIAGDVLGYGGEIFEGNPNGTYTVDITVTDANGVTFPSTGTTDYKQRSVTRTTSISIGYAAVNTGAASSTCVFSPDTKPPPAGVIATTALNIPVTGLWYISESNSSDYLSFDSLYTEYNINSSNTVRIGTKSHKSGTLAITANFKQKNLQAQAIASKFKVSAVHYYYRIVDTSGNPVAWEKIPRSLEYNKSGLSSNIEAPTYNDPKYLAGPFEVAGGNISQNANKWLQFVRAFDFLQVTGGENVLSVEYAFVVEGLQQTFGNNDQPVAGWVSADDLHYPGCIPWQGTNIASSSYYGTNKEYRYFRSAPANTNPNIAQPVSSNILYAETPYGEYVNKFYTDSAMKNAYLPGSGTEFVSFELDLNYGTSGIGALTDYIGSAIGDMTWSTQLNSSDGVRAQDAGADAGVNTTPTFLNYSGEAPNDFAGLSRIKTTQ